MEAMTKGWETARGCRVHPTGAARPAVPALRRGHAREAFLPVRPFQLPGGQTEGFFPQ